VRFRIPAGTGTPFQRRVWNLALTIPRGQVRTYGWMAKKLRSSPRAVGQALKVNPFAPRVPCHRVVSSDGTAGGFAGKRKSRVKVRLLAREGLKFAP